jgi:hypothetical protein
MTRLDWEKAELKKRRRPTGSQRKRQSADIRRQALDAFTAKHDLRCFKCGGDTNWAKTGISARGPWAVCVVCVIDHKRQQ